MINERDRTDVKDMKQLIKRFDNMYDLRDEEPKLYCQYTRGLESIMQEKEFKAYAIWR